jgi:hypothetical protein
LGPLFAEKAATLGRGKVNFNANYTVTAQPGDAV